MVQNLLCIWRTIVETLTTESAAYESSHYTRHKGNPTDFIFKSFNKECHISYDSMLGVLVHDLAKAGNLPSPELIGCLAGTPVANQEQTRSMLLQTTTWTQSETFWATRRTLLAPTFTSPTRPLPRRGKRRQN